MYLLNQPISNVIYKLGVVNYANFNLESVSSQTLDAWWKADTGLVYDTSSGVTSCPRWTSCEGNGYIFSQATKTAQPLPTTLNGIPALQFTTNGLWYKANYTKQLQDYTIFLVYMQQSISSAQYRRVLDKAYDTGFLLSTWTNSSPTDSSNAYGANLITYEDLGNYSTKTSLVANTPRLLTLTRSSGTISLYNYTTQIFSASRATTQFSNVPLYIAFSYFGDVQNPTQGAQGIHYNNIIVAELAIYSSYLSGSNILTIQQGLINKYKLTSST